MDYLILNADCRRMLIDLSRVDAVVSDPPYGMDWEPDAQRFTGGHNRIGRGPGRHQDAIQGDDEPFDPAPWLACPKVILWGANHFGGRLPVGTTLVWLKRNEDAFGTFLSDAEVGWQKGGFGVYCFKDLSMNAEAKRRLHQNQKPIALMRWCIRRLNLKPNSLILDPYMGSGSTLVAALAEGHRVIGLEIDQRHCATARRRIERPHAPVSRASREESLPLFH